MSTTMDIGLSALQTYSRALEVTSHNIANAATPGFTRQRAETSTVEPQSVTPGTLGRGVKVDSIIRLADELLIERLRGSQSDLGRFQTLSKVLTDAELVFNEPGPTGFASVLDQTFAALEDLSNNPELSSLRAGTVQNLRTMTSTVNSLAERLRLQNEDLFLVIRDEVTDLNSTLENIAKLNDDIRRESALGRNPNDLLDRREVLLNELSLLTEATVRTDSNTGMALVEINGRSVLAGLNVNPLGVSQLSDGRSAVVLEASGEPVDIFRGKLGAYIEMSQTILPQVQAELDELTMNLVAEMNAIHSTGTNHLARISTQLSEQIFDNNFIARNLDDTVHLKEANSLVGVPSAMMPDFTDGNGNVVTRNLTVNITNNATGIAEKYIVQYDPGSAPTAASRSIQDLASAINSGRGGGFTVLPPSAAGVENLTARIVSVDGGVRLELQTTGDRSLDFSQALDNTPTADAWTGDPIQIAGTDATLAGQRLIFEVNGANLDAYTLDPTTGNQVAYGSAAFAGMPAAIGSFTVTLPGGTTFTNGQQIGVDLSATGTIIGGSPLLQSNQWVASDAGFTLRGRYTGSHSYDSARPWRARVVQAGTIGSSTAAPMIEFTYYDGPDDARILETKTVTLDDSFPPGSQVEIANGVYAVFDAGTLSTGGAGLDLIIDGQPDQARILTGLGINNLFSGSNAENIEVDASILANPDLLAVAQSRAAGDNRNVLDLAAVRQQRIFSNDQVAMDDFYQSMVSDIGVRVQQADSLRENQEVVSRSLANRRDETSGVNIDEQIGVMILQQQAYTAAARIITMARENIDTLMDIMR